MKNYIEGIIKNLKKYSKKINNITLLTQDGWALIDSAPNKISIYNFIKDKELLISKGGRVKHGKWNIIHNNKILLQSGDDSLLFKIFFFDNNYLILAEDETLENLYIFVREPIFLSGINSFSAIEKELDKIHKKHIQQLGYKTENGLNEMLLFFLLIGLIIGMLFYIQYSTNN